MFVGQQRVDRVELGTGVRHAKIRLEVTVVVPTDGADAVAVLDACAFEGICELGSAVGVGRVVVAVDPRAGS